MFGCSISLACSYAPGHHWTFVTPVHCPRDHHLAAARLVQHLAAAAHRCLIATSNRSSSTQAYLTTTLALCFPKQQTARTDQSVRGYKTSHCRHSSVVSCDWFSWLFVFLPPVSSTLLWYVTTRCMSETRSQRADRTSPWSRPSPYVELYHRHGPSCVTLILVSRICLGKAVCLKRRWREKDIAGGGGHTLA